MIPDKTKKLVFWQSDSFFTLSPGKDGKPQEEKIGPKRPKDLPFIKGGRAKALDAWPKVVNGEMDDDKLSPAEKGIVGPLDMVSSELSDGRPSKVSGLGVGSFSGLSHRGRIT